MIVGVDDTEYTVGLCNEGYAAKVRRNAGPWVVYGPYASEDDAWSVLDALSDGEVAKTFQGLANFPLE